jgi:hypothetical protein
MTQSFVVGLNQAEVLRRRAIVSRIRRIGSSLTLVLSAIGMGLAVMLTVMLGQMWMIGLLLIASMLPLVFSAVKGLQVSAESKRWYDASGMPPFAMRMSPAGLELGCEGAPAPVVLPWPAVQGFRYQRKLGQPVLEISLAPGVTPSSPGVSGLDQPAARATLQPRRWIKTAGFYGIASLDQPVEAIDQALRYFSQGLAGVSR